MIKLAFSSAVRLFFRRDSLRYYHLLFVAAKAISSRFAALACRNISRIPCQNSMLSLLANANATTVNQIAFTLSGVKKFLALFSLSQFTHIIVSLRYGLLCNEKQHPQCECCNFPRLSKTDVLVTKLLVRFANLINSFQHTGVIRIPKFICNFLQCPPLVAK